MDKNFKAVNAPILDFEPGSKHREELIKEIERQSNRQKEVPVIIHGKEYYTLQTSMLSSNGPGKLPKNFKDKIVTYPRYFFTINNLKRFLKNLKVKVITIDDGTVIFGRDEMFYKTFIIIK